MRRQIATYLEELEQFRKIRPGNAKDLDKFADLLDKQINVKKIYFGNKERTTD